MQLSAKFGSPALKFAGTNDECRDQIDLMISVSRKNFARPVKLLFQSRTTGVNEMVTAGKRRAAVLIFEGFEVLDVYGPTEALAASDFEVVMIAEHQGPISSGQGPQTVATESFLGNYQPFDILLVPGELI